jgi:hypothetical protein
MRLAQLAWWVKKRGRALTAGEEQRVCGSMLEQAEN